MSLEWTQLLHVLQSARVKPTSHTFPTLASGPDEIPYALDALGRQIVMQNKKIITHGSFETRLASFRKSSPTGVGPQFQAILRSRRVPVFAASRTGP